jgi:plastocyanin
MRAAMAVLAVACVIGGVSVAAAAAPRTEFKVQAVTGTKWEPSTLSVKTGDTVTWDLNSGDGQPHNAKGVDGPPEDPNWPKFTGTIGTSGTETYTFTQPGTYNFVCQVHQVMTGTITVTGTAVTPTATPSVTATATATPSVSATATATATPTASPQPTVSATPTPVGSDRTTPAPLGTSRLDVTPPTVSKLKLKAVPHGAKVSFSLSEQASVTIRVKHGKTTVRTTRLSQRAGSWSVTIRGTKIVRGRSTVEVEARDARGNRAAVQRGKVRVTR